MKIAVLASGDIHTTKWVNSFVQMGHEVHLIMLEPVLEETKAQLHVLPFPRPLGGILNFWHLRRLLKRLKPDLLHVHGASLDGLLGRLSGFHPSVVSVLGSDVFTFPYESRLKHRILIDNLKHYDWIGSTSEYMAEQVLRLLPGEQRVTVTPFGVNLQSFAPRPELRNKNFITIGTVKTLHPKYGVDLLINAFARARTRLQQTAPDLAGKMRLLIVGRGPLRAVLLELVNQLGLQDFVEFVQQVPNKQVPELLNRMDVFVALSRCKSESFGVAVVEASACELPVVVSNMGGLPEVVRNGETGIIVEPENADKAADALIQLISDEGLRAKMGSAGRLRVQREYEWSGCVKKMQTLYSHVLAGRANGTASR